MYKIMSPYEMSMNQEVSADQIAEKNEKEIKGGYNSSIQDLRSALENSGLENWDGIFEKMKAEHDALFAEQMEKLEELKKEPIN